MGLVAYEDASSTSCKNVFYRSEPIAEHEKFIRIVTSLLSCLVFSLGFEHGTYGRHEYDAAAKLSAVFPLRVNDALEMLEKESTRQPRPCLLHPKTIFFSKFHVTSNFVIYVWSIKYY